MIRSSTRARVDQLAAGSDGVVDILVGRPLRAAFAAEHALGTAVEAGGVAGAHELHQRLPVVAERVARFHDPRGALAESVVREPIEGELLDGVFDLHADVDPVSLLQPLRRAGGGAGEHVGGPARHQGPHDVEPLLGEEKAALVAVDQRAQVRTVIGLLAVVSASLEQDDPLVGLSQVAGDRGPAGTGSDHHDIHLFSDQRILHRASLPSARSMTAGSCEPVGYQNALRAGFTLPLRFCSPGSCREGAPRLASSRFFLESLAPPTTPGGRFSGRGAAGRILS